MLNTKKKIVKKKTQKEEKSNKTLTEQCTPAHS